MPDRSEPDADTDVVGHGYRLDVARLLRHPGDRALLILDEEVDDLAITTATATTIEGELVVEAMSDSLTVSGILQLGYSGACRRCLDPTTGTVDLDIQEIFERSPVEGETYPLADDRIDVEPMVRELALLSLPLAPLCRDECQGPAPDRFPAEVVTDDVASVAPDPRWAALDDLVFDEGTSA